MLHDRIAKSNEKNNLGSNERERERELIESTKHAVDVGNRDLDYFSMSEHTVFSSNMYNVLPGSNVCLRNTKVLRTSDHELALKNLRSGNERQVKQMKRSRIMQQCAPLVNFDLTRLDSVWMACGFHINFMCKP